MGIELIIEKVTFVVEAFYDGEEMVDYPHDDETYPDLPSARVAADETFVYTRLVSKTVTNRKGRFAAFDRDKLVVIVTTVEDLQSTSPFYVRGNPRSLRTEVLSVLQAAGALKA